jgi:hypothetical protein
LISVPLFNSELPLLIIFGPKNAVVSAIFENPERCEVDEIGDLNPHRPVLTTQKLDEVSGLIRLSSQRKKRFDQAQEFLIWQQAHLSPSQQ